MPRGFSALEGVKDGYAVAIEIPYIPGDQDQAVAPSGSSYEGIGLDRKSVV